ncbi:MAG TPA: transaminase [Solirubrobacterales bacterium]|nr:transaminase [Solirubrobacterales bacterium]
MPAQLPESARRRLPDLLAAEEREFERRTPRSRRLFEEAGADLLAGVPMSWMSRWAGPYPVYLEHAEGAAVTDADGNRYADLCLGDTGAMAGHAPAPVLRAVTGRYAQGATAMLPTADANWVASELSRRFRPLRWQFTLTATDANRFAVRVARHLTGRPKVLVFNYCYHGTVDEAFATLAGGEVRPRAGNVGAPVPLAETTRVAEFNDLDGLERELAQGDVACVLTEPALTNIGIVLPEPGFHEGLRELTAAAGTLLIVDETHTLSAGPGGCTARWGLRPDIVTLGKAIGGGVPAGAFGLAPALAERLLAAPDADLEDTGGVGGTLAGNALSLAAMRATLAGPLADAAWERTEPLAARFASGVEAAIERHGAPWHVVQLGCRAEYRFSPEPPRSGGEAAALGDPELERYLHLQALNRGVLLTPFHNMALMSPATTEVDVDGHTAAFDEALDALFG